MKSTITQAVQGSIQVKQQILSDTGLLAAIEKVGQLLLTVDAQKGTVYSCGNGGSACDAMHLTEELVARYKRERRGVRAVHFLDAGTMSCWSNDYSFSTVFERQVETFCSERDLLVAISTSGNSENVIRAVTKAKEKKCPTIGLLGKGGGKLKDLCDIALVVPAQETERIQEAHILIIHILCEIVDLALVRS